MGIYSYYLPTDTCVIHKNDRISNNIHIFVLFDTLRQGHHNTYAHRNNVLFLI